MKLAVLLCLLPLALAYSRIPKKANVEKFFERVKSLVRVDGFSENNGPCDPDLKERVMREHERALNDGYEVVQDALDNSYGSIFGATLYACQKIQKTNAKAVEDHKKCVEEKNFQQPAKPKLSVPLKDTVPYLRSLGELWTMAAKFVDFTLNETVKLEIEQLYRFPKPCLDTYREDAVVVIKKLVSDTNELALKVNSTATNIENGSYGATDEDTAVTYATAPGLTHFSSLCNTWLGLSDGRSHGFTGAYAKLKACEEEVENKQD